MLNETIFKLGLCCYQGTNTSGELLVLWFLLYFSLEKNLTSLQVAGDFEVSVDWLKKKCRLQVTNLEFWETKVLTLVAHFNQLECQHIYRFFNEDVDELS